MTMPDPDIAKLADLAEGLDEGALAELLEGACIYKVDTCLCAGEHVEELVARGLADKAPDRNFWLTDEGEAVRQHLQGEQG